MGTHFGDINRWKKMQFKNAAKIAAEICPILVTIIKLDSFYRVHLPKAAEVFRCSPLNFPIHSRFPCVMKLSKRTLLIATESLLLPPDNGKREKHIEL